MSLPLELAKWQAKIEKLAASYGLDFFTTVFEVLDWKQMNMVAAYGGFPNRYPHWRFGMEYERLSKSYAYGLSKIYEMVINNDPCYAYLLHSNPLVDQKLVMAHVYGHCDFFKNNAYFAHTNRKMMDEMANHKTRVQKAMDRHGVENVESFIDSCLSLENLIDYHAAAIRRNPVYNQAEEDPQTVQKMQAKSYMDKYINPKEFIEEQQKKLDEEMKKKRHFPENPQKDVLGFLLQFAPLENWERDILDIVREEAYYFAPQGQTKILNEGFASYWHSKMMTNDLLTASELIDYADHHSGTVAMQPGQLNPYKVGIELLKDIEDRWNKGRFGKEYDECTDLVAKKNWDTKAGLGREKIFEVRKLYSDITFIDEFLTPEFCAEHKFFVFAYNPTADQFEVATRAFEKVKQQLLFQLTNFGQPFIQLADANYKNRGELMFKHQHEGVDLRGDWAKETLKALHRVWKRPVSIDTVADGVPKILTYDGSDFQESRG